MVNDLKGNCSVDLRVKQCYLGRRASHSLHCCWIALRRVSIARFWPPTSTHTDSSLCCRNCESVEANGVGVFYALPALAKTRVQDPAGPRAAGRPWCYLGGLGNLDWRNPISFWKGYSRVVLAT